MRNERVFLTTRKIPNLASSSNYVGDPDYKEPLWKKTTLSFSTASYDGRGCRGDDYKFACVSMAKRKVDKEFMPTLAQLLKYPLAVVAFVPKDVALFFAGAIAGAASKTLTAPLDRIKFLLQTHGVRVGQESAKKAFGFIEAITVIGKEEGIKGYWKGNLPQVLWIIPYSAVQLFAYENYKKIFRGKNVELSVFGRLAAGAFAGMTSTFVAYPLDVLRLRLAVEPGYRNMTQVALGMLRDEGFGSFYIGLGPSLIAIAPYVAANFCVFDLLKRSLPEKYQKRTEISVVTAVLSTSLATLTTYPLDTMRRQMQIKGTPYRTIVDALSGIIERDGVIGLYRGFVPNALKTLPTSRTYLFFPWENYCGVPHEQFNNIRLTTYDTVQRLITASEKEFQKITEENGKKQTSTKTQ